MVPVEALTKAAFAELRMSSEGRNAYITKNQRTVEYNVDSETVLINGTGVEGWCAPKTIDGTMFITIRDFSVILMGAEHISWNEVEKTAEINGAQ